MQLDLQKLLTTSASSAGSCVVSCPVSMQEAQRRIPKALGTAVPSSHPAANKSVGAAENLGGNRDVKSDKSNSWCFKAKSSSLS
jgi:hypothetical protein